MIVKIILNVLIMCLAIVTWTKAIATTTTTTTTTGCIAIFQGTKPIAIEVVLPTFEGGVLQTKQFNFANLPKNMKPDEQGRFCYPMDDERFAFVHVYYYAVKEIEDYNKIFMKLGLPLGKTLKLTLTKEVSFPTGGSTGIEDGIITYPGTPADISVIHHEIGHWVRDNAVGRLNNPGEILSQSSADFLAALHSGNTFIEKDELPASAYDINTYVHITNALITKKQLFEIILQDPIFAARFPIPYGEIKKVLQKAATDPFLAEYLNTPDFDFNASAINQPLWKAAMLYGVETIKLIYVKMLAAFKEDQNYSFTDIAQALIKNANEINPELGEYLENEFTFRGIFNRSQPSQSMLIQSQPCRFAYKRN